jgi:hypothetical protein
MVLRGLASGDQQRPLYSILDVLEGMGIIGDPYDLEGIDP